MNGNIRPLIFWKPTYNGNLSIHKGKVLPGKLVCGFRGTDRQLGVKGWIRSVASPIKPSGTVQPLFRVDIPYDAAL